MEQNPSCPACRGTDWEPFAERTYRAADVPKLPRSKQLLVSTLFKVWRPDAERVDLTLEGCRRCGMMIYAPRPTEADIAAKYAYLNASLEDATPSRGEDPARTRQRADRLFALVKPHLSKPVDQLRVLDFGGGDGRLMRRFIDGGAACELVDYTNRPVPGVTKIGDDQVALTPSHGYDVIVCSHVLEHLAAPADVLSRLRGHLADDGVLYVEVPMEVYGGLPIKTDPVTHVNFFTPDSLRTLLGTSGFGVRSSRLGYYPHPHGGWKLSVGAVAGASGAAAREGGRGMRELKRLIRPSLPTKLGIKAVKLRDKVRFRA